MTKGYTEVLIFCLLTTVQHLLYQCTNTLLMMIYRHYYSRAKAEGRCAHADTKDYSLLAKRPYVWYNTQRFRNSKVSLMLHFLKKKIGKKRLNKEKMSMQILTPYYSKSASLVGYGLCCYWKPKKRTVLNTDLPYESLMQ